MKILVYTCPECETKFYSRANHDLAYCSCGASILDGGHNDGGVWKPSRLIGRAINAKTNILELAVSEKQLYDDWNNGGIKYGRI